MIELKTENARIESTMLGRDDHGILTFWLILDFGGSSQGFGGYFVDHDDVLWYCVGRILDIVKVEHWEDLRGKYIRARHSLDKVVAIGNVIADEWFYISDELQKRREADTEAEE